MHVFSFAEGKNLIMQNRRTTTLDIPIQNKLDSGRKRKKDSLKAMVYIVQQGQRDTCVCARYLGVPVVCDSDISHT